LNTTLNSKQTKTKQAIFAQPTPKNITWNEFVSLLSALGFRKVDKGGSATNFIIGNKSLVVHRPHPEKTLKICAIQKIRNFLFSIGVTP